jgi:hypothetical protein
MQVIAQINKLIRLRQRVYYWMAREQQSISRAGEITVGDGWVTYSDLIRVVGTKDLLIDLSVWENACCFAI